MHVFNKAKEAFMGIKSTRMKHHSNIYDCFLGSRMTFYKWIKITCFDIVELLLLTK